MTPYVEDSMGVELCPGDRVAANVSGLVLPGTILKIKKGRKPDRAVIHVTLDRGIRGGFPARGHVSKIQAVVPWQGNTLVCDHILSIRFS